LVAVASRQAPRAYLDQRGGRARRARRLAIVNQPG